MHSDPVPSMPPPLYGLVLAGGRSTRMNRDKAALVYHDRPQAAHTLDLLSTRCSPVYLSCRSDQADKPGFAGLPQLHDTWFDLGPLGGILTAMSAHPHAAWLVAACDLPYLDKEALDLLVSGRDPSMAATAFAGPQAVGGSAHGFSAHGAPQPQGGPQGGGPPGGLPEPLFAIYEPAMRARLLESASLGKACPRKALINSPCKILPAHHPQFLANINHPEEFRRALDDFSRPRT